MAMYRPWKKKKERVYAGQPPTERVWNSGLNQFVDVPLSFNPSLGEYQSQSQIAADIASLEVERLDALPAESFAAAPTMFSGIRLNVPEGFIIAERLTQLTYQRWPEVQNALVVIKTKFEGYSPLPFGMNVVTDLLGEKKVTYFYRIWNHCRLRDIEEGRAKKLMIEVNWWLYGFIMGVAFFSDGATTPDRWWAGDEVEHYRVSHPSGIGPQ